MASPDGIALLHLVVGKHGSQLRAPVDGSLPTICNTIVHKHFLFLEGVESGPLLCREGLVLGAGCIHRRTAALCKCAFQFFDRTGLLRIIVVPAAEHFEECPLGPFVIFRVAGADFA